MSSDSCNYCPIILSCPSDCCRKNTMASLLNGTEFSCSLSTLSMSMIEDHDYWTLNPSILFGTPIVAVIKFMITILLLIIGIFVIMALTCRRKLRGFSEFPLFLNQTVVVILHSITLLLFGLVVEFSPQGEFPYGSSDSVRCGMCTFAGFLFILFNTVLLHTVAMNFLVLYEKLVFVFTKKLSRKVNTIMVIVFWFISFWIAIAPVLGFGSYEFDLNFGACIPSHTGQSTAGVTNRAYIAFVYLEGVVPLGISIYAWMAACRATLQSTKRQYVRYNKEKEVGAGLLRKSQRLLEVFMALLTFAILWIPLAIMAFVIIANPELSSDVYIICWLFYVCNPLFQLVYTILQVRLNF